MRTTTTILGAVCALALGGCCFGGGTPGATPPPPGTGTTGTTTAGGPMVTLAPGFAPDPMVLSGNAGGPVDATTQGAMCRGYIAAAPNHILNVTAPFPMLRITTSSSIDTTIVIRLSDGRVLCNDDFEGSLNAGVVDMFPIGQHQVWMGSYSMGGSAPYTLNISAAAAAVPGIGSILPGLGLGAAFPGVPTHCGMSVPDYGPIRIGTSVTLGSHTGWSGPDGRGGYVTEDTWWNDSMWAYVGQRTTVTELAGLDPVGCPYVRTAIDGGSWGWRIRNLSP